MARGQRRLAAAGGAGVVILIVCLLGALFPGFGTGGGTSASLGTGEVADTDPDDAEANPDETPLDEPGTTGAVRVVIETDGFSFVTEDDGTRRYEQATLERVVARAKSARRNERGDRIILSTRRGVPAGAHEDLIRALESAGIEPDEIRGYAQQDVTPEPSAE